MVSSKGEREAATNYARWLVRLRWLAVLALGAGTIAASALGQVARESSVPILLSLAVLAALNVVWIALSRIEMRRLLLLQIFSDVAIGTVILHYSGGIENPFYFALIFHVIVAGVALSRRECYSVAGVAWLLFTAVAWFEWAGILDHHYVALFPHGELGHGYDASNDGFYVFGATVVQSVTLFLVAYFVTTLTEQRRHQHRRLQRVAEQVWAERQLLEQALETTNTAVRVTGLTQEVRWVNERWLGWFGDRDIGPSLSQTATAPGAPGSLPWPVAGEMGPANQAVESAEVTLPVRPADTGDSRRVFRVAVGQLADAAGTVTGTVRLARDITVEKRGAEQLMRAAKLAGVGELAGYIAHEVNNPAAIISAKARLLLGDHRGDMSPRVAEEIGKIVDNTDRIARIAQGLLSYCRPSVATRAAVDIRVPIRRALSMVEARAKSGGVRLEDRFAEPLPRVFASSQQLEEVFLNLFLNALDAMPKGGVLAVSCADTIGCLCPASLDQTTGRQSRVMVPCDPPEIGLGVPSLVVHVADTGTGMSGEVRAQIFDPFFTTKEEGRGTGLGLAICLDVIREHGGAIEVESELGRGARFSVSLPLAAAMAEVKAPDG